MAELNRLPCMLRTGDLPTDSIAAYEAAFRRGVREYTAAEPGWEAAVFANTLQLFVSLRRDFGSGRVAQPAAEKRELLDEIMSYVEDHLAGHITLDDTARQFHVSASTVSQLFRKRMGVSYYRFVTQRRLIAAKTLIKEGTALDTVAESVGFSDYSGFTGPSSRNTASPPPASKRCDRHRKQSQAKTTKRHRRKSDAS